MKKKLIKCLKFFTAATLVMWVANQIITVSAKLFDKLDYTKEKHKYKWRFGDIFYTKKGSGTPLLLIHDLLPGGSGYEWNKIEDQLAQTHTVYTVDLLGCGRSAKPAVTYTNFLYVQMLCDFITHVIKEKTEVIASGYSGSFVVSAALYNKEVIRSISLVNPTDLDLLSKAPGQKEKILRKILETPLLGTFIYYMAFSKINVDDIFTERYYYNPFHVDKDLMDVYYESAHKNGADGKYLYASLSTGYIDFNIVPALMKLDIPVKLIMGSAENNQKEITKQYSNLLSDAEIVSISKSKHFPHIENSAEFLEKLS